MLERDDPSAALIKLEQQGLSTRALLATMAPLLLGDMHEQLDAQLYQRDWRAGFLRQCQFTGPIDVRALTFAPMRPDVSSIGAALAGHRWTELRELTYELPPLLDQPLELADLAALAKREVAPKLERLTIRDVPDYRIATMTALLEERGVELTLTAC